MWRVLSTGKGARHLPVAVQTAVYPTGYSDRPDSMNHFCLPAAVQTAVHLTGYSDRPDSINHFRLPVAV